jgi:hypothetical protein
MAVDDDPVGNIVEIDDAAQPVVFYNGANVTPNAQYVYDAIYRLIQATGRELAQQGVAEPRGTALDEAATLSRSRA